MIQIFKDTSVVSGAIIAASILQLTTRFVFGLPITGELVADITMAWFNLTLGFFGGMWVAKRNQERAR